MKRYLIALNFESDTLPEWWPLVPAGHFGGRDGRHWINDRPDDVITFLNAQQRDMPLDESHSTELKGPKGEAAPARGFFTEYENREGVVYGRVDLNAIGRGLIEGKEYKYYSPAFLYDEATLRVIGLSSVGLTNKHNLLLPALNNQQQENTMSLALIAATLGLAATADEGAIMTAINAMKSDHVIALNSAQTPDAKLFVPMETHTLALNNVQDMTTKYNDLVSKQNTDNATALIDDAIANRKIAPANRDHFLALCQQENGVESVTALLDAAPTIITDDSIDDKAPANAKTALNSEENQVFSLLGLDLDDMAKQKAQA